jgi:very-short-patch-repair endonuclease
MPWNQPPKTFVSTNARVNAPKLRRTMTEAERALWKALRNDIDLPDSHFRRQVAIGSYVVDFLSLRYRVVVEVDGKIHSAEAARRHDEERDMYLRAEGFRVLRFANDEVTVALPKVLDRLKQEFGLATPTPDPSPQGGGGLNRP